MIAHLSLENIRCYHIARIALTDGASLLLGANGCGKTSVIEAIHVLATTRSFRTTKLNTLIRFDQHQGRIRGQIGDHTTLAMDISPRQRKLSINQQLTSAKDFCQQLRVVALAPDHMDLVVGGPQTRRRYLDQSLFHAQANYFDVAATYRQALRHKQALLTAKLSWPAYQDQVAPWNQVMVEQALVIRHLRQTLISDLQPLISNYYHQLAQHKQSCELRYHQPQQTMSQQLAEQSHAEYHSQRALYGPHRDDVIIYLDQNTADISASQGEKSSLLLALKLAEIEYLQRLSNQPLVLLLDDIGHTLDPQRRMALFSILAHWQLQTVMSAADPAILPDLKVMKVNVMARLDQSDDRGNSIAQWLPS